MAFRRCHTPDNARYWVRAARDFCQAEPRLATIQDMGRKDKGREICINCGQTFHKKLTSKELRCTKCRKAEKKAA
jgi:protein-arginine kinase activator protein McsA